MTPTPAARTTTSKGPAIDGIHIKGLYLYNPADYNVVSDFVENLRKSDLFNLDKNQNLVIVHRTPQDQQNWAFDYELQLNLKHSIPLQ